MIIATATSNASSAFHQHAPCSHAAPPVPAITGAIALGKVRGRAPSTHCAKLATPYGAPSAPITVGTVGEHPVAFLPRHGVKHEFSAHTVPYRANMWALRALGVRRIFGPCAVGSLTPDLGPGAMVVPDQLVDRTSGRTATYFDSGGIHVSFADPYCPELRAAAAEL